MATAEMSQRLICKVVLNFFSEAWTGFENLMKARRVFPEGSGEQQAQTKNHKAGLHFDTTEKAALPQTSSWEMELPTCQASLILVLTANRALWGIWGTFY